MAIKTLQEIARNIIFLLTAVEENATQRSGCSKLARRPWIPTLALMNAPVYACMHLQRHHGYGDC